MVHFGHFMVRAQNEDIAWLNAFLADIPLLTGCWLNHWQHGLNAMLEKVLENLALHHFVI